MICSSCNANIGDSVKFCPECGAKQNSKCSCGYELKGEKFCPECGTQTGTGHTGAGTPPPGSYNQQQPTPSGGQMYSQNYGSNQNQGFGAFTGGSNQPFGQVALNAIEIPAGTQVGRYIVKKKLGQGGFGAVFEAEDTKLKGRKLALKVLPYLSEDSFETITQEFFSRERIRNQENILRAYEPDSVEFMGQKLIVYPIELADGGSFREKLIEINKIEEEKERSALLLKYFKDMCNGVNFCHEAGIVHLDIKPENFLFLDGKLKVTDFGISSLDPSQNVEGRGTSVYMAPEQHRAANPEDVDKRADIYALGVILYEMLSGGKRPYGGSDLANKKRDLYPPKKIKVSEHFWRVIEQALHPDMEERFESVIDMLSALDNKSWKSSKQIKEEELLRKEEEKKESEAKESAKRQYRDKYEMAMSDGVLTDAEKKVLNRSVKELKLSKVEVSSIEKEVNGYSHIQEAVRDYKAEEKRKREAEQRRQAEEERAREAERLRIEAERRRQEEASRRIKLRSSYKDLSEEQVESMIKGKGFSDKNKNKTGVFLNDFESKTISGEKVVIDKATGLMWHQSGSEDHMNWSDAKEWVRDLNRKAYAGYSDWRLPTLEEGASLLESGENPEGLYIDSRFSTKQKWIWTGDSFGSGLAWYVDFDNGDVDWVDADDDLYVRPVRSR